MAPMPVERTVRSEFEHHEWSEIRGEEQRGFVVIEVTPVPEEGTKDWLAPWADILFCVKQDEGATAPCVGSATIMFTALGEEEFSEASIPRGRVDDFPLLFGPSSDVKFTHPEVRVVPGVSVAGQLSGAASGFSVCKFDAVGTEGPALGQVRERLRWVVTVVYCIRGSSSASLDVRAGLSSVRAGWV
jgi:hypothetical protein